jgi:hypothetical protein
LILAIPGFSQPTRPLVECLHCGLRSGILVEIRGILLPHNARLRDDYLLSAEAILESGCTRSDCGPMQSF